MILPLPAVPWQVTGNHWVTLPCIHPGDAAIHMLGVIHARSRSAIEFAGSAEFAEGGGAPLARLAVSIDGRRETLGAEGIAWEREVGWVPSFSCRIGDLALRGTICAPHGKNADVAGAVIAVAIENRGDAMANVRLALEGTLGHRQMRVRTASAFTDGNRIARVEDSVVLDGNSAPAHLALAIGSAEGAEITIREDAEPSWEVTTQVVIEPGKIVEQAFLIAAGPERDGAVATLAVMRRRGWRALLAATRTSLREMEPATGVAAADRLIARNLFFTYFCSVARALDDAHVYVVRSRLPWNGRGVTIRDWEALMWVLPAVQLADAALAREVLLRVCELHGYAPGGGVHYLDGSLFEAGFSLEGAAAYPIAVDSYIVQTGDDRIVEEGLLADSLYGAHEDIEARRHPTLPLYATEVNPDGGVPSHAYTAHGNAIVALAFEVLRRTLDEKTSEKVEDATVVRAALLRHFGTDSAGGKQTIASASDLAGNASSEDEPAASLYWLPYFDFIGRDDSTYRRSVKPLETVAPTELLVRCARLIGPASSDALDWMRRAPLDGGRAAERVDAEGRATGNGGDAALSGLLAYLAWYSVHALGAKA